MIWKSKGKFISVLYVYYTPDGLFWLNLYRYENKIIMSTLIAPRNDVDKATIRYDITLSKNDEKLILLLWIAYVLFVLS